MKCPCPEQQDIPDGSKFCGHCGQPISERKATTASFETASEMPFSGSAGGGTDAGPTLIAATMPDRATSPEPEPEPEAAPEQDLQATLAMEALPLQKTEEAASPGPDADMPTVEEPAAEESAEPAEAEAPASIVLDPVLTGEQAAEPPKPTELAKAVEEEKPTEPEPATEPAAAPVQESASATSEEAAEPAEEEAAEGAADQKPPAKKRQLQAPPEQANQKRGFRETMWFMDALDQDALGAIETEDIRDRAEKFDDDGREIDANVRKQFSLQAGAEEAAPGRTMMKMARQKFDEAQTEASSAGGGGATVAIVLGILAALGVAAYFLLFK